MDFQLAQACASAVTSSLMQGTMVDQRTDLFIRVRSGYIALDSSVDMKYSAGIGTGTACMHVPLAV